MKRTTLLLLMAMSVSTVLAQDRKVAVFDPAGNADNSVREIVREVISSVIVNTDGYTVLERQLIDRVLEENRFQTSGLVDDAQISEMGRMMGANLVFVTSVIIMDNNFFVSGKLVDAQTAHVEMQRTTETRSGTRDLVAVVQRMLGEMFGAASGGQQIVTHTTSPGAISTVHIPEGTRIIVQLEQYLSGNKAQEGQVVLLSVVEEVRIDDVVVIAQGAGVTGKITLAQPRRRMGRTGKLDFSIESVTAVDQSNIFLRYTVNKTKGGSRAISTGVITAGVAVVAWPVAPLVLLRRGNEATVEKGTVFEVFTDQEHLVYYDAN